MKKIAPIIIAIIAAGGVSFYGGMKYQEGKTPNFQNLSQEERQQMFLQGGVGARGARTGADTSIARTGAAMNSAVGEIISKDDKSITVKLRDGGSKIVFFSEKTAISKTAEGSQADVVVGENVTINGSANSDGSVTATMIQIRPALPPMPSGSPVSSVK